MVSKIKNIIIFTVVITVLILIYIFFVKKSPDSNNLISSVNTSLPITNNLGQNPSITSDLLSVLLSVKNIRLDDSIFSNPAFINLRDSSIILNPTGDEGRSNPFAPIGFEKNVTPVNSFIESSSVPQDTSSDGIIPNTSTSTPTIKTPIVNKKTPINP